MESTLYLKNEEKDADSDNTVGLFRDLKEINTILKLKTISESFAASLNICTVQDFRKTKLNSNRAGKKHGFHHKQMHCPGRLGMATALLAGIWQCDTTVPM